MRIAAALPLAMRIAALAAATTFAAPAVGFDGIDTATGSFRSLTVTLNARSAVAFRGRSFTDAGDALIVAISNAALNAAAIGDYVDRRRVLETRVRGGDTGVVYFEFAPDGHYRGMSYQFGPGNGCSFCRGEVASTVTLANGRLSGKLTSAGKERSFEITLVTPGMAENFGAALPPGGGAPGSAYLAYHAALATADRGALKPLLSGDQRRYWDETAAKGGLAAFVHALADAHPVTSVAITEGFATETKAVLLITGEAAGRRLVGEALLLREDGAWRVDDELTERER
jgi:hypothetical protein